jgi:hypothetical protein
MSYQVHKSDRAPQYTYPQTPQEEETIDVQGVFHFLVTDRKNTFWKDLPEEVAKSWIKDKRFTYIPLTDGHILQSEQSLNQDFPGRLGYVTDATIDPVHKDIVFTGKLFKSRVSHLKLVKGDGIDFVSMTHAFENGKCIAPIEVAILRSEREAPRRGGCFVVRSYISLDEARKRYSIMNELRKYVSAVSK